MRENAIYSRRFRETDEAPSSLLNTRGSIQTLPSWAALLAAWSACLLQDLQQGVGEALLGSCNAQDKTFQSVLYLQPSQGVHVSKR